MIAAEGASTFSGIVPTTVQASAFGSYCNRSLTQFAVGWSCCNGRRRSRSVPCG